MLDKPSVIYFFLDNYYYTTPGDFSQSRIFPTYHFVQFRGLSGKVIARSFFMDDFGTLQPVCFTKLAVAFTGGY
jgi:hypothetical protein